MTDLPNNKAETAPGFAALLESFFSPIELWGILLHSFGRELWRGPPALDEQQLLFEDVAHQVSIHHINPYFFNELVRLRPDIRPLLNPIAMKLEIGLMKNATLKRRPIPPDFIPMPSPFGDRFLFHPETKLAWDKWLGENACINTYACDSLERLEAVYYDLLELSQLPHGNLAKISAIERDEKELSIAYKSHGVILESLPLEQVETVLYHLLSGLDAAHQRGIYHGPLLTQDLRCDDNMVVQISGFGRHRLGKMITVSEEDYGHLADWLLHVSDDDEIAELCQWIRHQSDDELYPECVMQEWRNIISEEERIEPIKRVGIMDVECPESLTIRSWFSNGKATVTLRNLGDGPLPVRIESDQPWIVVLQPQSDPNLVVQDIDLVFSTADIFDVSGESTLRFFGPDEQVKEIRVYAKKSYWLWPALIGGLAFLIIMYFLKN